MKLAILFHFQLNNCKKNSYYFAKFTSIPTLLKPRRLSKEVAKLRNLY